MKKFNFDVPVWNLEFESIYYADKIEKIVKQIP